MIKIYIICDDKTFSVVLSKHLRLYIERAGHKCEINMIKSIKLNTTNRRFSHVSSEVDATCLDNVSRVECKKNYCTVYYDDYYEMYNPRTVSRLVSRVKTDDEFLKLNRSDYVRKSEIVGFKGEDTVVTKNMSYIKITSTGAKNISTYIRCQH